MIVGGAVVTAALYFTVFKSQDEKNAAAQHALRRQDSGEQRTGILPAEAEADRAAAGRT